MPSIYRPIGGRQACSEARRQALNAEGMQAGTEARCHALRAERRKIDREPREQANEVVGRQVG